MAKNSRCTPGRVGWRLAGKLPRAKVSKIKGTALAIIECREPEAWACEGCPNFLFKDKFAPGWGYPQGHAIGVLLSKR